MQSPQMIWTFLVARTLCPHWGQMSFRVELGRLPPGVAAPGWAVPPAPVRIIGGRVLRPILISLQPFSKAYSTSLSLGRVFQPYFPVW